MYLGIDLGTSNSAIVGNDGNSLRLYKTVDGADVLPSAIMIDRRGGMFVGKRAYEQDAFSPENVGKKFKRLMGTSSPIEFKSALRTMSAEDASAEILKALLAQAKLAAGEFNLEGTVITIPAAFNQMQCEATMRAAQAAGIGRIGLVQEPIAAAMASIADRQKRNATLKDGQFLVYDLGGGTFDVAIVQSVGGTINVVGHGGINMLGGTDFDRRIVNSVVRPWLMDQFDLPEDLQKDPIFQRVLRVAAFFGEKAKIELSAQPSTRISADETQIAARDLAGKEIYLDIPFDRQQLDDIVGDQIDRSIEACRKLLKENGYEPGDIDRVVFIGGPTRMPIVRTRVPEQLGIQGDLDFRPDDGSRFRGCHLRRKPRLVRCVSHGKVDARNCAGEWRRENRVRVSGTHLGCPHPDQDQAAVRRPREGLQAPGRQRHGLDQRTTSARRDEFDQ